MHSPSAKLVNILIGKAAIETLLVGAIAVGSYSMLFPPTFHGWGEAVNSSRTIMGWAVNDASPWERVEVQLFVDEKFVAAQPATLSRPDVKTAGWAKDEWHGYSFLVEGLTPGPHEARVYAVRRSGNGTHYTLQLLGDPISFAADSKGLLRPVAKPSKSGLD